MTNIKKCCIDYTKLRKIAKVTAIPQKSVGKWITKNVGCFLDLFTALYSKSIQLNGLQSLGNHTDDISIFCLLTFLYAQTQRHVVRCNIV